MFFVPDCTNPFLVHFHTDALADLGTDASIVQFSRGELSMCVTLDEVVTMGSFDCFSKAVNKLANFMRLTTEKTNI
jgi:hypothetical protein